MLTLAAVYRLGTELVNRQTGLWSAAALAVLYWHVHLSHIALRAITMPLLGALAFTAILNAYRTNQRSAWWLGGLWLGLLAYTYFAARVWLVYGFVLLLIWLWPRRLRRGALQALLVAVVVTLPQAVFILSRPDAAFGRIGAVAVLTGRPMAANGRVAERLDRTRGCHCHTQFARSADSRWRIIDSGSCRDNRIHVCGTTLLVCAVAPRIGCHRRHALSIQR